MSYPSDLSLSEWKSIVHLLPKQKTGKPKQYHPRQILNAILYVLKTGCPWRSLPNDLPPWKTVYFHFSKWRDGGVLHAIQEHLLKKYRKKISKSPFPSLIAIDSACIKSSSLPSERGFDGHKKNKRT